MSEKRHLFILVGNGPYDNRGCEAIVRGTVDILRRHFADPQFLCISHFQSRAQFEAQCRSENDPAVHHARFNMEQKVYDPGWWTHAILNGMDPRQKLGHMYRGSLPDLKRAHAILSVGGDNYSLEYGLPDMFLDLDAAARRMGRPFFLWGASIGPFDSLPEYEKHVISQLKELDGIFARESLTAQYLAKKGITENVFPVADPAFVLTPKHPEWDRAALHFEEEAIGINLSPLLARYTTDGDVQRWAQRCADILREVSGRFSAPIFLIPHVVKPTPDDNDHLFMQGVLERAGLTDIVTLIPPLYTASETKWIIGKMTLFIGSRTHAVIAALSSKVPTLSLGYSVKARGINQDIFGNSSYCCMPQDLVPAEIADRIQHMYSHLDTIRSTLDTVIPKVQDEAVRAGACVKTIVGG